MTTESQEGAGGGDTTASSMGGPRTLASVTRGLWDLAQRLGCVWVPPSPLALPEGILHPAVFEHLLGAGSDALAFFQTVLRPFDGRAADHPTRAAIYQQAVFVLRADPAEAARVALAALESVGLEPAAHDLRFADRHWESRALDAQGAGWELEVDGLGVVRICALQRFAGRDLDPAAQVVTVGVERLAMVLEPKHEPSTSQGSLSLRSWPGDATLDEVSSWSQTEAPAEWLESAVENDARGARHALGAGLPRIAYEQAVSSLVRLDQLSLHGLLPLKAREERLEEIRRRVAEIADALVSQLATAIDEPATDETATDETAADEPVTDETATDETVSGTIADEEVSSAVEPSAVETVAAETSPTEAEGTAVESGESEQTVEGAGVGSPDAGGSDPSKEEPVAAERSETAEPDPSKVGPARPEVSDSEPPEPSETETSTPESEPEKQGRRRPTGGRRKSKKGRRPRRSKDDGSDAEDSSS